jgi:uncharacterized protein YraI
MRYRNLLVIVLLLGVLAACNLAPEPDEAETIATPTGFASGKPVVVITAPRTGDEVVVNTEVLVSATATDSVGVQRVQLLANGQIVKTVSSESASGDTSMNVLLDYTPRTQGEVTLQVIAYRGAVASDPAEVRLTVRQAQAQVTATAVPAQNVPVIDPNDPTCRVLTNVGLNLRQGPGTNYPVITVLRAGAVAPIIGRLGTNEWWQLRVGTSIGWVSAAYTTVYGNCGGVPIANPPPSPTGPVVATATPIPTQPPQATSVPQATTTPGLADLVITEFQGPEVLPLSAPEVTGTYGITITNFGGRASGQFNNVVIKSPGNVEIALGVVGSLDPGQSVLLTIDVSFDTTGSYTLQVRSDSNAQVQEQSEVNNNALLNVDVVPGA